MGFVTCEWGSQEGEEGDGVEAFQLDDDAPTPKPSKVDKSPKVVTPSKVAAPTRLPSAHEQGSTLNPQPLTLNPSLEP